MKTTTMMKRVLGSWAVCLALGALADGPTISDVVVRQRWPWSRLVDINYVLSCETTQRVDVAVTGYNGTTALTLPADSFSGDLYGVSDGSHRIVWDPTVCAYTNSGVLTKFRVALAPTEAPVYMIVDLTKNAGADGQIEYIYPGDERLETYGRFTNVWFGVTNDSAYATTKLVLRRVHAGSYMMGDSRLVTLTKDFYAGIFEITQKQWELIMNGSKPSYFNNVNYYAARPVEQVTYNDMRGSTNGSPAINWPMTGHMVSANSFMGRIRAATGFDDFDLPTEAQWEYACRAGTTTIYNDGNPAANLSGNNTISNIWLDALGRYRYNGGQPNGSTPPSGCLPTNGSAIMGSYLPNNWGLYDMHGNAAEMCLDWKGNLGTAPSTDPVGPASSSDGFRVDRGGCWGANLNASQCTSSTRLNVAPGAVFSVMGLRVIRVLP